MKHEKQEKYLRGMILLPLAVGGRAILVSDGNVIRTSRVVAIHAQTDEMICFETLNTQYHILVDPYLLANAERHPLEAAA